jgi:hypothetical protein
MTLLRIAGITDHDRVVREIHRGFKACPEIQIPLQKYVKNSGNRISEYRCKVQTYQDDTRLLYERSPRFKSYQHGHADGFFGNRRMNDHSKPPPTPKPSECRYCGAEFPSRSRLHTHLRTTGHHQRESNCRQLDQFQHAFFGITIQPMATEAPAASAIPLRPEEAASSQDSSPIDEAGNPELFSIKTGYKGVTVKERGYPRSPVSDCASLSSSFTTEQPAFPFSLCFSSMLPATSAARRLAAPLSAARRSIPLLFPFSSMLAVTGKART